MRLGPSRSLPHSYNCLTKHTCMNMSKAHLGQSNTLSHRSRNFWYDDKTKSQGQRDPEIATFLAAQTPSHPPRSFITVARLLQWREANRDPWCSPLGTLCRGRHLCNTFHNNRLGAGLSFHIPRFFPVCSFASHPRSRSLPQLTFSRSLFSVYDANSRSFL